MKEKILFTSESVTEGHPDKVADQISDAILDAILAEDPHARVACETIVNTGLVVVFGEVSTEAYVDIQAIVRQTLKEIGYTRGKHGFDAENVAVLVSLDEQSPDIAQGVDSAYDEADQLGAGDQGLMFGYATTETEEYLPLPIALSHALTKRLAKVRHEGILDYLYPDGKSQVTVEYNEDGSVKRIDTIVVSAHHSESATLEQLRQDIEEHVIRPVIPTEWYDDDVKLYINPTGRFTIGGPQGDSGLTGRKIIVDTYGGMARHGGGAFSGKDATKVDRSASYMARYLAKNIVASGLASRCEIQLAYAIGVAEPVSIRIDTFGTHQIPESQIIEIIRGNFDLTPQGIIKQLDLRQPIFAKTAAYGHFGRLDQDFPWERLDQVELFQQYLTK